MHEAPPALTIQAMQKEDGEGQKLQQQPLLLSDGLEMLVQEAEKNLFNSLVKQFAPRIIALLMNLSLKTW
jgi:hypothetical protein